MGRDKAMIPVGGVAMAARVAGALEAAGASTVVAIGGDTAALAGIGLTAHPDDHPGDGPLPATITALATAPHGIVVVAPCDLVDPDPDDLVRLLDALRRAPDRLGAVPVVDGRHQWATMAWRTQAADRLRHGYAAGHRSLRRAAPLLPLVEVTGFSLGAFADADEPADLP
jgi:molybdopterin-guanine dinucleotide biosynthesis protein A